MNSSITSSTSTSKTPTHAAYHVRDRKGGDAIWTRIGSAWTHADGKGFNVQIDSVPLDGKISLRIRLDKAE